MRKIEEVLRLKWQEQRSAREIARSVGIGRTTVAQYLARAAAEGMLTDGGWRLAIRVAMHYPRQVGRPEGEEASL